MFVYNREREVKKTLFSWYNLMVLRRAIKNDSENLEGERNARDV